MVPPWRVEPFFPLIIMFRKQLRLWRWHQNSARGGAELRTMKRLQGWSRFGSTFFLSACLGCSQTFNGRYNWQWTFCSNVGFLPSWHHPFRTVPLGPYSIRRPKLYLDVHTSGSTWNPSRAPSRASVKYPIVSELEAVSFYGQLHGLAKT